MKRRDFLKTALTAPLVFHIACNTNRQDVKYLPATAKSFEFFEVSGSYFEIGRLIGKAFRSNILRTISDNQKSFEKLKTISESQSGKRYSEKLYRSLKMAFPHLADELNGLAQGAGIHFNTIWNMSIRSELFALALENPGACDVPPGCSTIYYKNESNNWLFHNEDGDKAYKNEMYVLKANNPSGVSFYSFVYPGIIPGVGPTINSEGIIHTCNFIGCKKPEEGVPRYFTGRAILEAKSINEALQIATYEPRAFPWHHNIASVSSGEYVSAETLPGNYKNPDSDKATFEKIKIADMPYLHTNHTIGEKTRDYIHQDTDYRDRDSAKRMATLTELKNNQEYPVESPEVFLEWLSSRKNAPYCPCKVSDEDSRSQTLGTAYFDINSGNFRLYRGAPCESVPLGLFTDYSF